MRRPVDGRGTGRVVVGPWGAIFISVGLLVSVLGAYLAWSLICAEVLSAAARNGDLPALFATENQNKVPAAALWLTNIVVQLFVISTYWSTDAFTLMLSMTSVMTLIPFLLVALFGYFLVKRGETYEVRPEDRRADFILATIAVVFTPHFSSMRPAGNSLFSPASYIAGYDLLFVDASREGKQFFKPFEWVIFLGCRRACSRRNPRARHRLHHNMN